MKFSLLVFLGFLTGILTAQIITPAYVISNGEAGIKRVVTEARSEFKDFRISKIANYNKQGFPISETVIDVKGTETISSFTYRINEDDSTFSVTKTVLVLGESPQSETYNYKYTKGGLWESKPVNGNETVVNYKHYKYDENWNLVGMDEIKVIGADTNVIKTRRYSVQTDVFHKLISTSHSELGSRTDYYYGEDGLLLSKAIFDGQAKRTTEHRMYNADNLIELTVEVINRGGNLMGIEKYSYQMYRKGKPSIFEKWMPVAHPESVMQER